MKHAAALHLCGGQQERGGTGRAQSQRVGGSGFITSALFFSFLVFPIEISCAYSLGPRPWGKMNGRPPQAYKSGEGRACICTS